MNYRNADLNLLKVFEALMTEGNVTRAASKLSLTQPAVSNALRRLRDTFDDPLFVRSGAGVNPTRRAIDLWEPLSMALHAIRATMDVVQVGEALGLPIWLDRYAAEADWIGVINRVKPHTNFSAEIESGLLKMALIGLGKHTGAALYHRAVAAHSFDHVVRTVGRLLLARSRIAAWSWFAARTSSSTRTRSRRSCSSTAGSACRSTSMW